MNLDIVGLKCTASVSSCCMIYWPTHYAHIQCTINPVCELCKWGPHHTLHFWCNECVCCTINGNMPHIHQISDRWATKILLKHHVTSLCLVYVVPYTEHVICPIILSSIRSGIWLGVALVLMLTFDDCWHWDASLPGTGTLKDPCHMVPTY